MANPIDILLINPGDVRQVYQGLADEFTAIEPPAFAGLFATYLRRNGCSVAILDVPALGITAEKAAEMATQDFDATLIVLVVYGFQPSASTQNMGSAGKISRCIRDAGVRAKVMMTGTHPAALPERTLAEEAVDFVCDGEGPETIYRTFEALRRGAFLDGIPSLWGSLDYGITMKVSPLVAGTQPLITDLDKSMPGIAWDLLPMDRYRAHNWHCLDDLGRRAPYAAIHTSLGCPYSCHFCCINAPFSKPSYRLWSPETVISEIDLLVTQYGVRNIKIVDEMFVLNKRHVLGICELLKQRQYDLNIWAYARVDTVHESLLEPMKAAGINWLALGIESASWEVRDGADKHYGDAEITDTVRRIQGAGINVMGNYIFGLPDDDMDSMRRTLGLAIELNTEFANFYSCMAYPGSALYRTAKPERLPQHWHQYSQHAYDTLPLANDKLMAAEIVAFRDYAWHAYFSAPRYRGMVENRFGDAALHHINRMESLRLPRIGDAK